MKSLQCSSSLTKVHLLIVIVIQWILFILLLHRHQLSVMSQSQNPTSSVNASKGPQNHGDPIQRTAIASETGSVVGGVAVTLMFRAPQWFHLRYTAMVLNALSNIPDNWKVQIVYNQEWFEETVLPWHPGIKRWFENGHKRIEFTAIPAAMLQPKQQSKKHAVKPKHVATSRWFWQSVIAEHVLLFSGNGAFCSNHFDSTAPLDLATTEYDFIGTPWNRYGGQAGDGSSHSYRKRSAMLRIIDYAEKHKVEVGNTAENLWLMHVIEKMNKDKAYNHGAVAIRIATEKETHAFGAITNMTGNSSKGRVIKHIPMVVAGTQSQLTYEDRDTLLKHCPEVKLIFPSLHEPACFGAHPNPAKCKASICALQDEIPQGGC
ncbi:hypothetical protein ACA910_011318 [Epithemia clementina (nom. ined.)]